MDNVTNTVLLYKICEAFYLDQEDQQRKGKRKKKISRNALQKLINQRYPGGNKMTVRTGFSIGEKLSKGEDPNASFLITFDNLERLCKTILADLGMYEWPKVREVIAQAGDAYASLNKYVPKRVNPEKIEAFERRKMFDLVPVEATIGEAMRAVADSYEELITELVNQNQTLMQKNDIIQKLSAQLADNQSKKKEHFIKQAVLVLQDYISKNPETPEAKQAKELLSKLNS